MNEEEKSEVKSEEPESDLQSKGNDQDDVVESPEVSGDSSDSAAEASEPAAEASEPAAESHEAAPESSETDQQGEASAPAAEAAPEKPDWKDLYARMRADFDNFRKRTERDREELAKFAAADVLKDVLSTVDNLARALDGAKDKKDDPFVSGVQLVYDSLLKTLSDHGATPLDSLGEPFDANYHEALATLPSPDVPEGNVMNEVKRGWLLNGKLLRAAQVVVSSGVQK